MGGWLNIMQQGRPRESGTIPTTKPLVKVSPTISQERYMRGISLITACYRTAAGCIDETADYGVRPNIEGEDCMALPSLTMTTEKWRRQPCISMDSCMDASGGTTGLAFLWSNQFSIKEGGERYSAFAGRQTRSMEPWCIRKPGCALAEDQKDDIERVQSESVR
jgi:hypothetical protein